MADSKRRLPVFKPAEEEADEARPPWHWIGFGTAAIFAAWLPLAYAGEAIRARILASRLGDVRSPEDAAAAVAGMDPTDRVRLAVLTVLLSALPLVLGAMAGGFLVGRWGKGAGVREAALAGVATALLVTGLTWAAAGLSWAPLLGTLLAVPSAAWGGHLGHVRRARLHGPDT